MPDQVPLAWPLNFGVRGLQPLDHNVQSEFEGLSTERAEQGQQVLPGNADDEQLLKDRQEQNRKAV